MERIAAWHRKENADLVGATCFEEEAAKMEWQMMVKMMVVRLMELVVVKC